MSDRLVGEVPPVMIVDDEIEITKSVTRDLRRVAQCESFTNPRAALDALRSRPYSVIISDLKMPDLNGLELLQQAASLQPAAQRILLTAFVDLVTLEDGINKSRLHKIMTKPWEPAELAVAVDESLRTFQLTSENTALRRLALTDALTGVSNHRYFWERLESEFSRAQRYGRPLSLIMADVDDFKKFNDMHGHQHGDDVLRKVALALETGRRSMDTVARYGGEEFAVILPESTRPQATEISARLIEKVKQEAGVGISMGVASYPDDATSTSSLVFEADQALLTAKSLGKSRVINALDMKNFRRKS